MKTFNDNFHFHVSTHFHLEDLNWNITMNDMFHMTFLLFKNEYETNSAMKVHIKAKAYQ